MNGFIKLIILLSVTAHLTCGFGQIWQPLGSGTNYEVRSFWADTLSGMLHVSGSFRYADALETRGYAIWDGAEWHAPQMFDNYCGGATCNVINRVIMHEGKVFVSGLFGVLTGEHLLQWDGLNWNPSGSPNKTGVLSRTNNQLFFTGQFDSISNIYADKIARWNGSDWESFGSPLPFDFGISESISNVTYYAGEYYCSGNFAMPSGYKEIMRWDGNAWNTLSSGIFGDSWVNKTIVFNDILYVGGFFLMNDGNAASFLMAWNGTNWVNPFADITFVSQVRDLVIIDNDLYIVGDYFLPNECCMYSIGKFDGEEFCTFGGYTSYPYFNSSVGGISGLHNNIYISGTFIHGQNIGFIASLPINTPSEVCLSIPNITKVDFIGIDTFFSIYPNPSTHTLYLTSPDLTPGSFVHIYNLSGQLVYEQNVLEQSERLAITTADIGPPGMYLVQLHHPGKAMAVQKLVVAD